VLKNIIISIFLSIAGSFLTQLAQAQGTLYLSNLGVGSSGSIAVAGNAWAAAYFQAGDNFPGGYVLNSIQLLMNGSSGNPGGFAVSIYDSANRGGLLGNYLGSLSGPDPINGGVFSYTPTSTMELDYLTGYYIVVSATTPSADGSYFWNQADSYNYSTVLWPSSYGSHFSTDGIHWTGAGFPFQFAIFATEVPEPTTYALAVLGLAILTFLRRNLRQAKLI
jgi:hypothetical protein